MATYEPVSPCGSTTYEPVSPCGSTTYEPVSPRVNRHTFWFMKPEGPKVPEKKFSPITGWRDYIRMYLSVEKRNPKFSNDEEYRTMVLSTLDKLQKDHEKWENSLPTPRASPTQEPILVSPYADHVVVRLRVTKSGTVRSYVGAPMESIYENYYNKCKFPPLDVKLKALKNFGYPNHVLEKVLINAQKPKKNDDDFIESIFGNFSGKTSKPKKKSVMEELRSRLKIKKIKSVEAPPDESEE
jgi:hypothetical protein